MKKFFRVIAALLFSFLIVFVGLPYAVMLMNTEAEGLNLTDRINAMRVSYLCDLEFLYYEKENAYVLRFGFENNNDQNIVVPANVAYTIKNQEGEVIYKEEQQISKKDYYEWSGILYGKKTLATIYIQPYSLPKSESKNGTVTVNISLDGYFRFDECTINTNELPTIPLEEICTVELPELPKKVKRTFVDLIEEVIVEEIKYEFKESLGGVALYLYFTGEKTYDKYGEDNSDDCMIGWKLYDKNGYVVDSGTAFTQTICVGEKFKDCREYVYNIEPGNYRLELMDIT